MKRASTTALALSLLVFAPQLALARSGWQTNLEKAKTLAKKKKLPLLVEFTGSDWCKNCILLERKVFKDEAFKSFAKGFVLVELDYPLKKKLDASVKEARDKIRKDYSIEGFPTVLFLDAEGSEVGRLVGYDGKLEPSKWVERAKGVVEKGYDPETGKAKGDKAKGGESGEWLTNYEEARKRSKESGKPILVDFTGSDWCGWCVRLKKEVFDTDGFKSWAKERVILLELDFPSKTPQADALKRQNEGLARTFKIEGFPTILFLDHEGKELGRSGYLPGGPKAWIADAEKSLPKK